MSIIEWKKWSMKMNDMSDEYFYTVYVYPDGEQYDTPPEWKSDDYEVRQTTLCNTCEEEGNISLGDISLGVW